MDVIVKCDRCGRAAQGQITPEGTVGFYWIRNGSQWQRYCHPGEEVVCEFCMWNDTGYIIDYGPRAHHLN